MQQYTGSPTSAQTPGSQPLPGAAPLVNLPQDLIDGLSVSTISQAFKALTDNTAYMMAILNGRPYQTPGGGALGGFTAVVRTGTGPSTGCVPATVSSTIAQPSANPVSVVVKIILGGAIGVATFQWSNDGGTTFSGTITTAATFLEASSGITVAFSGTLIANDTYAFAPTDNPQFMAVDQAGHPRTTIDHCGYRMGAVSEFRENWIFNYNQAGAVTTNIGSCWYIDQTAGGSTAVQLGGGLGFPYLTVGLSGSSVIGNRATVRTQIQPITFSAGMSLVTEFWASVQGFAVAGDSKIGWSDTLSATPANAANESCIQRTTSGNWKLLCSNGIAFLNTDSGVAPNGGTSFSHVRLELHGAASPLGARSRLFISGTLVADVTTNQPTAGTNLYFLISTTCLANASTAGVNILGLQWSVNQTLPGLRI